MMIDRDQLRAQKQAECDARVEKLHQEIPRLEEIARAISLLSIERIRSGILQKNAARSQEIECAGGSTHRRKTADPRRAWLDYGSL